MKCENKVDNALRVLNDMLTCGACSDLGDNPITLSVDCQDYLTWQYTNMPAIKYVTNRINDYIFSNGFTTGDEEKDIELDNWMYKANIQGVTNYNVLRSATQELMIYGHSGVRWLDEQSGIVSVSPQYYGTILDETAMFKGVKVPVSYIVSQTQDQYLSDIDLTQVVYDKESFLNYGYLQDVDNKILMLPPEDFMSLRWDPNDEKGTSPLMYDRQRLNLLLSVYQRLNYDIKYDGPGRLILSLSGNVGDPWGNETSSAQQIAGSKAAQDSKMEKARAEIIRLGEEIKHSNSDAVIALSNIFSEKITHLPRVTKGTEFFSYISTEGEILCQVYGVPPALLELGKVFGNVSMQKIIDNAIVNSIVPIRERIATQISPFLAPRLGVDKIFFNKYELDQIDDENNTRKTVADIIKVLQDAGYDELAGQFAALLEDDITIAGEPAKLKVKQKKEKKTIIQRLTGGK